MVELSWQAPLGNGSSAVRSYRVYRGIDPGALSLAKELGNLLSYTDGGLINGQTYHYKVSALNSAGEGARSGGASATPGAAAAVPSAPLNLLARPGNAQVALTWDPPADTGGAAVTAYRIYRGNVSGQATFLTETGSLPGYTNTGLQNGRAYFFQVSARNSAGEGPRSAEANATPAGGPGAPSEPRNLTYVPGASNITLNWEPPAYDGGSMITGYSVYRGTVSGSLLLLSPIDNLTTFTDSGLLPGVTFHYQVSARNALGNGPRTPELRAMPLSKPSAPLELSATAGVGSVALAWKPPASDGGSPVQNYNVYRGTAPGGETFLVMLGAVTAHNDAGLANGVTYFYQVSAANSLGEGPRSAEANATPQASFDTPSAPRDLSVTDGDGRVDLAWSPPANEGGGPVSKYTVYRDGAKLADLGVVAVYADTGLANGEAHSYEVSASNSIGEGPKSAAASATPARVPDAPLLLKATPSNRNVSLSWQAPASDGGAPVTGYAIFRDGASLAATGAQTTFRDGSVQNGQSYVYKVAALNRKGQGPFSNDASAMPNLRPVAFSAGGADFDAAVDIGTDSQGNIYITGHFRGTADFDPGAGTSELTSAGDADIFAAKYDVDGNFVWAFRIGGTGADMPWSISVSAGGAFWLAGQFSLAADFDPGANTAMLASLGGSDAFAAKYASDGSYIWAGSWGGAGNDGAGDLSTDSAGNCYVTGHFEGTVDFDPGTGSAQSASAGAQDAFVSSFGPGGAFRWHFALGSTGLDTGRGVQAYANGTFWIAGLFNGSVDFDPGAAVNLTNSSGYTDIFLARYTAAGAFLWAGAVGGPENDTVAARGLALDGPGNVYITGSFVGLCDFQPTNQTAAVQSNGLQDAFLAEYDQAGEYRWAYGVGGPADDFGSGVAVDDSGSIYWTGCFRGSDVDFDFTADTYQLDAASSGSGCDIFLAKYLPGGLLDWAYAFGAQLADKVNIGNAVCVDINGNVLLAGQFHGGADFDPTAGTTMLNSAGTADLFVVRLDADGKPA
jgi:hypothetical protein